MIKKRKQEVVSDDIEEPDAVYYEKAYDRENVDDELEKLEPDVKEIIKLRYFEEMSLKEISAITGYNLNTLKLLKENMEEATFWVV